MPILHLDDVGTVVGRVLQHGCERFLGTGRTITLSRVDPGAVAATATNTINLHLYHVEEPPHTRGGGHTFGKSSRSELPLALVLHYVVTAHHSRGGTPPIPNIGEEHFLYGLAMKALHDYPSITATTSQPGSTTTMLFTGTDLAAEPKDLELTIEPISVEKSLGFWTAAQTRPRPAGFLEVGIVELRPESAIPRAGPVIEVDMDLHVGFGPRLLGSSSMLRIARPDGSHADLRLEPAMVRRSGADQTQPVPSPPPDPDLARVVLTGTGLRGTGRQLALVRGGLAVRLDLDGDRVAMPLANQHWRAEADDRTVTFSVHPQITDVVTSASVHLAPGIYRARVIAPGPPRSGGRPQLERCSNDLAIAIAPAITSVAAAATAGFAWRVDVDGADLGHSGGAFDNEVAFSAAGDVFEALPVPPPVTPPAPPPSQMRLNGDHLLLAPRPGSPLDAPATGTRIPLSLMINGVAAPPLLWTAP